MNAKKTYEEFLALVKQECKKSGVKLDLRKTKHVKLGSFRCGGFFSDSPPHLVAALKHPDAKILVAHEFCHMTQWREGIPLWDRGEFSVGMVDKWLEGEDIEDIETHIKNARDLELDNEIRTSKLVEEYDLDIDPDLYIKKCNAYVLFYNWVFLKRKWSNPNNPPYGNQRILDKMSPRFDMDYSTLSPELIQIFEEERI
jgi:hypothetical protein